MSTWIKLWFVTVVPKYLNFAKFSKDLSPSFMLWFWPAFWWRDINIYFVSFMFTSITTSLLASITSSTDFAMFMLFPLDLHHQHTAEADVPPSIPLFSLRPIIILLRWVNHFCVCNRTSLPFGGLIFNYFHVPSFSTVSNLAYQLILLTNFHICYFWEPKQMLLSPPPPPPIWMWSLVHRRFLKRGLTVTHAVHFLPPLHSKHEGFLYSWLSLRDRFLCDTEWTSQINITETYQLWDPSEYLTPSRKKVATLTCNKCQKPTSFDATHCHVYFSRIHT
jgi:hypothetical protein